MPHKQARERTLATIRSDIDAINRSLLATIKKTYRPTSTGQPSPLPATTRGRSRFVIQALAALCPITPTLESMLKRRIALVREAGSFKDSSKQKPFRLIRELEILHDVCVFAKCNRLAVMPLYCLFRELISYSLAEEVRGAQQKLTFHYLGPESSYSHIATQLFIGNRIPMVAWPSIIDVTQALQQDTDSFAVIPVENSTSGFIRDYFDLIPKKMTIIGEIVLPIRQQLLRRSSKPASLTAIYAHPQSFLQCLDWLSVNAPHAKRIPCTSNSAAARKIANSNRNDIAAIASTTTAQKYQLQIASANIQDFPLNRTKFLVIGRPQPEWQSNKLNFKTSLMIKLPNEPGSLYRFLKKTTAINITRIESRHDPKTPFRYQFHLDFEGSNTQVLNSLSSYQRYIVRNYGSYPTTIISPQDITI